MDVKKLNTDIVIVGGGGAACRAAIEVSEKGLNCIMVDKGRPGRSGATPCALSRLQWVPGEGMREIHRTNFSRIW